MIHVVDVKPLNDYKLYILVDDGRCGTFDPGPYMEMGIFTQLKEESYFNRVRIENGIISWPNGQDFAPVVHEMTQQVDTGKADPISVQP
jgi:hypothetical protein